MYYIGIDSGSTNCKIVLYKNEIIDYLVLKTSWNPLESADKGIKQLLDKHQLDFKDCQIITTGYGREIIDFSNLSLTEISCHALGGSYLNQTISGIIDIGGQDCKIIELKNGRVTNFFMNDKCAAGTGSFLAMTCDKLGISLADIDSFIVNDKYVNIVSMCAVFAESEIVGLLAKQVDRSEILLGVIVSIAQRIKQMLAKVGFNENDTLLITGGLAQSKVICQMLAKETKMNIVNNDYSLLAGALGAALYGEKKLKGGE